MSSNGVGLSKSQLDQLEELQFYESQGTLSGNMFEGIDNEVYHHPHCPGLSNSSLGHLKKSYKHLLASKEQTLEKLAQSKPDIINLSSTGKYALTMSPLDFGNMVHELVLEPDKFHQNYFLCYVPEMPKFKRTKEEQAAKSAWLDDVLGKWQHQHKGKTAVNEDDWSKAHYMKSEVVSHPVVSSLLGHPDTKYEVTFFSTCPKTKVLRKCRADIYNDKLKMPDGSPYIFVADLKTTGDASPQGFSKSIVNFDYDRQAAYYTDIIKEVKKLPVDFCFIPVEKQPPYGVTFQNAEHLLETGKEIADYLLEYYADCIKKDSIAQLGYSTEIINAFMPAYGYDTASRRGR